MEAIEGIRLENFWLTDLRRVADLIYYDGPILSHFKNNQGDDYLYCWSDADEIYNRWLIFRVSRQSLNKYLTRQLSLRELMLNSADRFLHCIDIDDRFQYHHPCLVFPTNLPAIYLPEPDSYYNFEPIVFDFEAVKEQPLPQLYTQLAA